MSEFPDNQHFQMSAVSRLTGLAGNTIRTWENRYQVVEPERTETGRRMYSREDIRHLTLLKTLIDAGHSIGSIHDLSSEQLEIRLRDAVTTAPVGCRTIIAGEHLLSLWEEDGDDLAGLKIVSAFSSFEDLVNDSDQNPSIDLLIVECPTLFPETLVSLDEVRSVTEARRVILIYAYAAGELLAEVSEVSGMVCIRGPITTNELRMACHADIELGKWTKSERKTIADVSGTIPERRFSNKQLAKLSRITSSVECECPKHLANLLFSLSAFESYSSECKSRNPKDEAIHRMLYETTAHARSAIEQALKEVINHENIEI